MSRKRCAVRVAGVAAVAVSLGMGLAVEAAPLRVFVRAGPKSHGPGAHDHPAFLRDWVPLLNERGLQAEGSLEFPTDAQLDRTDVLIIHCDHGGNAKPEQQAAVEKFVKRGGGLVVIHAGCVGDANPEWYSRLIGGSWRNGRTKWLEGPLSLYFTDQENPITRGASNFDLEDEIYYDMDLQAGIKVLAAAYTPNPSGARDAKASDRAQQLTGGGKRVSVYDIQPQMWTWENTLEGGRPYRAFVCIPGHQYATFGRPNFRAVLLRGIAWAGGRADCDAFCAKAELDALRFPEGGPATPRTSLAQAVVHPEFTMTLVASEPLVNKVMNVDWDPQGRLWAVETPEYPNGRRVPRDELWKDSGSLVKTGDLTNRPAVDKVSILVDTDGDGVADRKQIFFEGLELVTSMVFHRDGVIVSQAPDILWLRDPDGDGKADKVEKLYTGLGNGDTHAVINNLRWGFDGWIYATLGYSAGHPKSPDGSRDFGNMGPGVVRFLPDGSAFEQVASKGGNTWGLDIAWDNEIFFTQPTSGQVFMHVVVPETVLARGRVGKAASYKANIVGQKSYPTLTYEKQAYVQIDQVGMFTAAAGCAIYDGGAWPAKWNYSYFTTEPTINIIHQQFVTPEGPTYVSTKEPGREEAEFIGSRDYWWRPIETRIGPDGALYLCDFYNQAVIHNDTRGPHHGPANAAVRPDRDHYFARIWRVQHHEAKPAAVPDLSKADFNGLAKALGHPNRHVRNNALRLAVERWPEPAGRDDSAALAELFGKGLQSPSPETRVATLWLLHRARPRGASALKGGSLLELLRDRDPAVRKNAAQVAALRTFTLPDEQAEVRKALASLLDDANPRVVLQAIVALGSFEVEDETARKLVARFARAQEDWTRSAIAAAGSSNPAGFLPAALSAPDPEPVRPLVAQIGVSLAESKDGRAVGRSVVALAAQPASADALKHAVLSGLAGAAHPEWTPEVQRALSQLLGSRDPCVSAAALPLIASWDKGHALAGEVAAALKPLLARLADGSADAGERARIGASLVAARALGPDIVPAVLRIATAPDAPALQTPLIAALGDTGDPAVGAGFIAGYGKASDLAVREALLNQIVKRTDWSLAMVDALKTKTVALAELGPIAAARLRTHADKKVADAAVAVINELRGPQTKAKDELVAKFLPAVQQQPDLANGKTLFTAMCLICHSYKGEGKKEFAPDLTGMGLHGPEPLLTAVLDPNREVDPGYLMHNVTTKKGDSFSGIIARENASALLLRHAGGEVEIKKSDVASRVNAGISLMPDGLESLGAGNIRDIIGYLTSDTGNYRLLDLSKAFTSDSRRGLYQSVESERDNLPFTRFGIVTVKGVPFSVVNPEKSASGRNVLTLKGGAGYAKTLPRTAVVKVGFAANRLHFLGGVGGWAAREPRDGETVLKATVVYADGAKEELVARNGIEFADYNAHIDVPGSMLAEGLVQGAHQVRAYTRVLGHGGVIERIELESPDNRVAPTTVAITAEVGSGGASLNPGGAAGAAPAQTPAPKAPAEFSGPVPQPPARADGPRILIVGGGSSHNFDKFFHETDRATLAANKPGWLEYTDNANGAPRVFANVDLLVWSANQGITDDTAKALQAWADAGKPLVLVHPGLWYNWKNFPEWNREIVGGGSRGHDAIQEFEVKAANAGHPVMAGVPAGFKVTDELYYMIPDEQGTPIEVLATATSPKSGKTFPSVWIVKHPKARIACIAPGHDARAHDLPEYKRLLQNAVNWAVGK